MISSYDEHEIFIPDSTVHLDLECPHSIETGDTAICNVTVYRGTDLEIEVQFADAEPQVYRVPGMVYSTVNLLKNIKILN